MVGDIILGVKGGEKKRMKRKRVGGPRFAWEDKEGNGNDNDDGNRYGDRGLMAQAPNIARNHRQAGRDRFHGGGRGD